MSRRATSKLVPEYFGISPQALHHGAQLAVAVLLGYFVAALAGLPERFWVVITVLIVMRADSDSTLDVGWERVRGTMVGCMAGMAGVALKQWGANPALVGLVIISLLAFASALVPMLRSAAVAALIILGAGELAGHSILQVALLRVLQIGIGVGVCVALALVTSRISTKARLQAGCASLVGRMAQQMQTFGARERPTEAQMESASAAVRSALQGLATLAVSADRSYPWTLKRFRPAAALGDRQHRRLAALTSRVVQDVATFNRVLYLLREANQQPLAHEAAASAGAALASVASCLSSSGQSTLDGLRQLSQRCAVDRQPGAAMLAAPLRLLLDDLQYLGNSMGGAGNAVPIKPLTTVQTD